MNKNNYYVYIITNKTQTVLYVGVTNNLSRRIYEHKNKLISGFSSKYNLTKLVYCESYFNPYDAICREKQLKNWHRSWKINLIKQQNPTLKDLFDFI
ncbi:MAG: GIY-YIG nuclease family protein [Candidatus Buchananbacteria bacterium]